MNHVPPGIKKAAQSIIKDINANIYTSGNVLPSIVHLAENASVSKNTMNKALALLRNFGIIEGYSGRKSALSEQCVELAEQLSEQFITQESPAHTTGNLSQRVSRQIKHEILNGTYGAGNTLPSLKELEVLYHCTYRTLKKALDSLCSEGLLVSDKKTYSVRHVPVAHPGSKIVFCILGNPKGGFRGMKGLSGEYLRELEIECTKSRIGLQLIGYDYYIKDDRYLLLDPKGECDSIPDDDSVLGYIVWVLLPEKGLDWLIRKLSHIKKPVAIIETTGGWKLPSFIQRSDFRLYSTVIFQKPAQEVARYLLDKGHRAINYISPFHTSLWSKNRFEGLREVYNSAGFPHAVTPVTLDRPPMIATYYEDAARDACDVSPLLDFYRSWAQNVPDDFSRLIDPLFDHDIPNLLIPQGQFRQNLNSLFDQALRNRKATAWVCANDNVALAALSYLQNKKIRIPDEIAVVGFDNSQEALQHNLTSYNFNIRAILNVTMDFVRNPKSVASKRNHVKLDTGGFIIERMTTN